MYIESKLKETMIENLKEEVYEKGEDIKIYKQHQVKENKSLSKAINDLYNKRLTSKQQKTRLRLLE